LFYQLPRGARVAETVPHPDGATNYRHSVKFLALRDDVADPPRQPSYLVLFGGDDYAGFFGRPQDGSFIDRFKRVQVDYPRFVAEIVLYNPGRPHSFGHHW